MTAIKSNKTALQMKKKKHFSGPAVIHTKAANVLVSTKESWHAR